MTRRNFFFSLAFSLLFPAVLPAQGRIRSPKETFGFEMGADRKLVNWPEVVQYLAELGKVSDRVRLEELGKTTLGKPFIAVAVSAPENLKRLDYYRSIQQRLSDARGLDPAQAESLVRLGKAVVLITCNAHSTEIASSQTALQFVYDLATARDESTLSILSNTILFLVPSLNPDGQQMVVDWYRKYVGTPYEACPLPELYHPYVGHDNNRDWYMFTQVETQLTVSKLHNAWHPQIVYDVHQMGARGARMFVPPWIDPIDPNIDPILQMMTLVIGTSMATDLTAAGKKGIIMNVMFDLWTPSRHYQNYHGGIRILTESASARIASPITIRPDQMDQGRGFDPRRSSWNHPEPWPGGEWHLRDIVEYQLIAFRSVLESASRERERLLRNFYLVGKRAVERKEPFAFVIPAQQRDPANAAILLEILQFGMVEVYKADAPFTAERRSFSTGSYIIPFAQPYGAWAKTLLERQNYPNLREYADGPPKRPYDVTAHTLPLLMGVEGEMAKDPIHVATTKVLKVTVPPGVVHDVTNRSGYLFGHEMTQSSLALNRLLKAGYQAQWVPTPVQIQGRFLAPGSIFIPMAQGLNTYMAKLAREANLQIYGFGDTLPGGRLALCSPKIGIYKSFVPSMDEGWTRWILERYEFPFVSLYDRDVRAGSLKSRLDVIVLPDQTEESILNGWPRGIPAGRDLGRMPDEYTGGLGEEGVRALREFVESGGSLVALNEASNFAIHALQLPVKNVLSRGNAREFYCPGSLLRVSIDNRHPLAFGLSPEQAAWVEGGLAFESADRSVSVPIHYSRENLLMSGWLLGGERIEGKPAVVEVAKGKGRVILLGFRPQYRGQSYAMYPLFFNSLYYSCATPVSD